MLLAVDIGNTHTVLGLYRDEELWENWRIATDLKKTEDEYAILLSELLATAGHGMREIKAVVISSTVPPLINIWTMLSEKYFERSPLVVTADFDLGMPILLDHPEETGPDRIVNGIAAIRKYGHSLIVVDLGTANTFDCISAQGEYLGGAIAPGIYPSINAMATSTAKLPKIELQVPQKALGKNTNDALESGIIYGFVGQIDGIVKRLKAEMGGEVKVIATGGMAKVIADISETIDVVDPLLTLDGLNYIFRKSINKA